MSGSGIWVCRTCFLGARKDFGLHERVRVKACRFCQTVDECAEISPPRYRQIVRELRMHGRNIREEL